MAINIERAVDFAVTYLSDMNDIDENKIDDFVDKQMNKLLDILYKEKANEIEKTKIKKIINSTYTTKVEALNRRFVAFGERSGHTGEGHFA